MKGTNFRQIVFLIWHDILNEHSHLMNTWSELKMFLEDDVEENVIAKRDPFMLKV